MNKFQRIFLSIFLRLESAFSLFPVSQRTSSFKSRFTLFLIPLFAHCAGMQTIPEPNLSQFTVISEPICFTWNWHPFCVESKPNSVNIRGILNNTTSDKRFFLEYYLDSFDSDIPVGVSLKIDGTYYNLKKSGTDYTDTLKMSSELTEDVIAKLKATNNPITFSYSNRKMTLNFDLSSGKTDELKSSVKEVHSKVNSLQKMRIVK